MNFWRRQRVPLRHKMGKQACLLAANVSPRITTTAPHSGNTASKDLVVFFFPELFSLSWLEEIIPVKVSCVLYEIIIMTVFFYNLKLY